MRNLVPPSVVLLLSHAVIGCSEAATTVMPRLIPVQAARTLQLETYTHDYYFRDQAFGRDALKLLIGSPHYDEIERHACAASDAPENQGSLRHRNALIYLSRAARGCLETSGSLVTSLSPDPWDPGNSFFLEGTGSYDTLSTHSGQEGAPVFQSRFSFHKAFTRASLKKGYLDVEVRQLGVQQVSGTYYRKHTRPKTQEVEFRVRVHFHEIDADTYTINYFYRHEVLAEIGQNGDWSVIGCMTFHSPARDLYDGKKLVDLRGLDLVYNDYDEKLKAAGYVRKLRREHRGADRGPSDAGDQSDIILDCYCPQVHPHALASRKVPKGVVSCEDYGAKCEKTDPDVAALCPKR